MKKRKLSSKFFPEIFCSFSRCNPFEHQHLLLIYFKTIQYFRNPDDLFFAQQLKAFLFFFKQLGKFGSRIDLAKKLVFIKAQSKRIVDGSTAYRSSPRYLCKA